MVAIWWIIDTINWMEWVKDIIGMNYYWLISNCSFFFCFRLSLRFAFILSLSLLYLSLCVCLIASLFSSLFLKSSHYIYLYFSGVHVFCFCSHDAVGLFLCIFQIFSIWIFGVLSFLQGDALLWHQNILFKSDQQYIC